MKHVLDTRTGETHFIYGSIHRSLCGSPLPFTSMFTEMAVSCKRCRRIITEAQKVKDHQMQDDAPMELEPLMTENEH